jgi:hypothetical protein
MTLQDVKQLVEASASTHQAFDVVIEFVNSDASISDKATSIRFLTTWMGGENDDTPDEALVEQFLEEMS